MADRVRLGIIDSGVSREQLYWLEDARDFTQSGRSESTIDLVGHGTKIAEVIQSAAPDAALYSARAFASAGVSSPRAVAAALDWLCSRGVEIVNMSFGLTADRPVLREACKYACAAGAVLIASAPARGAPCYPAAYEGVLAITGDARCARGEVSLLATGAERTTAQAMFGTWCDSPERQPDAAVSGASIAAAHFSGLAARWKSANRNADADRLIAHFSAHARFVGRERRGADPDARPG